MSHSVYAFHTKLGSMRLRCWVLNELQLLSIMDSISTERAVETDGSSTE